MASSYDGMMRLTLVDGVNCETNKDVVDDDHNGAKTAVTFKKGWFVLTHHLDEDMAHEIANRAGSVEIDVVGVQTRVLGLE